MRQDQQRIDSITSMQDQQRINKVTSLQIFLAHVMLFIYVLVLVNVYIDLAEVSEHVNEHVINCQCQ